VPEPEWRCWAAVFHPQRIWDETDVPTVIRNEFPGIPGADSFADFAREVTALGHEVVLTKDDGDYRRYNISGTKNEAIVFSDPSHPDYNRLESVVLIEG
jgi:hypothetical protein